jgi:hypothetical protein
MPVKFHPREKVPINFKRKIKGEVKSIFDGESRLLLVRPEDNLYRKSIVLPETLLIKMESVEPEFYAQLALEF